MVGTMYSGEGDFDRCCESVRTQTYECKQVFITGLPEVEAHAKLYKTFKDSDADYLLKLDADMVLRDNTVVDNLVKMMQENNYLRLTHYVNDFYTNRFMLGIHFFSKEVEWKFDEFKPNYLFPDCLDTIRDKKLKKRCCKVQKAIANHCFYSTKKQAFHFGYHRFLKGKITVCRDTIAHLISDDNEILRHACLGIIAANRHKDYDSYSYGDEFETMFNSYSGKEWSTKRIIKKAQKSLPKGKSQPQF